jgi:hypothetical protein
MIERNTQAFSAGRKRVAAAAVFTLGLTAAAAAFAVGYTGALRQGLAGPASAPRARLAALEQLDRNLGYGGFLRFYGAFLATGDRTPETQLHRLADEADASLAEFSRASTSDADVASAALLRRLEAPFRRAAGFRAGGTFTPQGAIPAVELERDYAALKPAIAAAAEATDRGRLDILVGALVWAEASFLGALLLLSIALIVLAWLLRERGIAPVENLRESMAAKPANGVSQPLQDTERGDQIGAVARSAEQTGPDADPALPQLHLKILEQLAQNAARLESEMSKTATAIQRACMLIEEAGLRAAEAGQAAIEATARAHDGVKHVARPTQDGTEAAAAQLSRPEGQSEQRDENANSSLAVLRDGDAAAVLERLADGLDALERYARERHSIDEDQLVPLSWALFRAVDRLNTVAHRLSGTADPAGMRAAQ